jgi:HAD superfamily hydrolase (TIGR01509 family)
MKQMNKIAAVLFDMDGLMFDTEPLYHRTWGEAAAALGFPLKENFFSKVQGRNNRASEAILVADTSANFPLAEFRKRWRAAWVEHIHTYGVPEKSGLRQLLAFLQKNALPLAVATSSNRAILDLCLQRSGLQSYFTLTVSGEDIENGKPAPDIYLLAAEKLGVRPEACLVLEDSDAGCRAALAAGMHVFAVPDEIPPAAATRAAVTAIYTDLSEVQLALQKEI